MPQTSGKNQDFYRWTDARGSLHIVSSPSDVPPEQRSRVEHVGLESAEAATPYQSLVRAAYRPDWSSFALGFGAALLLVLLLRSLPTGWRGPTRVLVVLGLVTVLTLLYLGTLRRAAGIPGADTLASPRTIIDDAKKAVQDMNARQKAQQQELESIERDGK